MIWQDFVFLAGNVFSVAVLAPTLRDRSANVPLGTSLPSLLIGFVYGTAFLTMGMTFSAVGAVLTGLIWGLIAVLRSPTDRSDLRAAVEGRLKSDSNSARTASPPRAD